MEHELIVQYSFTIVPSSSTIGKPYTYLVHTASDELLQRIKHNSSWSDLLEDLITVDVQLYTTDFHGKKLKAMDSLDDMLCFLGYV
uniref:Uncharacterized protein n=1 Tax=Oryza nivara TaxID=4536 RepID=A0A0E0J3U7_ORYNI